MNDPRPIDLTPSPSTPPSVAKEPVGLGRASGFGVVPPQVLAGAKGLDFVLGIFEDRLPAPPIARTLDFDIGEVAPGRVVFVSRPAEAHLNPLGTVHGGYISTLLDSCMGCAVHSLMEPGQGYTTLELKVNFLRPVLPGRGQIRAIGTVINLGRRTALAEARLEDEAGRLLAHGSSTCLVFPLEAAAAGGARG